MGKSPSEIRQEQRKPVKVFINFRTIDQFYSEIGTNLSLGGVFVRSSNPLPVGTEIKISFNIPQFGCYLESQGVVVHNGTLENPGMGIKFKGLSDRAKKLLQDVLDHELLPPGEEPSEGEKGERKKTKVTVTVESQNKGIKKAKSSRTVSKRVLKKEISKDSKKTKCAKRKR
ncbi:MAG: PilZ domain-containing protein [Myxococcota bacterium]